MSTIALPPSYSTSDVFNTNNAHVNISNDPFSPLPAYSPATRRSTTARSVVSAPPKEFNYDLQKKGKLFAEMTIVAESGFSKTLPTFLEGQPVKGRVKLCVDKPDSFNAIIVHVQGQVVTGANQGEQLTFIDIVHPLWSQTLGDPRNTASSFRPQASSYTLSSGRPRSGGARGVSPPSTTPSPPAIDSNSSPTSPAVIASAGLPPKFTGKFPEGEYTWEFSIHLPRDVVLPSGPPHNEPQVFHPPQTFNERHTRGSIVYETSVKFSRNKLFTTDSRIVVPFGYIPLTRPPPFPPLRRLAYQEGTPLIGPSVDPSGWHPLEPVRVMGKLFNNRTVDVGCTVFLAKPLAYTRGSVIPLCMELESQDLHAVDLLSSPKAIVARLRRRIKYHYAGSQTIDSHAWKDSIDHSQLAVWWPSAEGSESGRVFVNGELHLRPDVKPTSLMAHFCIEYSVVLFPFDAAGFEGFETEQLVEIPVDVVTAYAPGPRPTMSAPPGYESADVPLQAASNMFSMNGFL